MRRREPRRRGSTATTRRRYARAPWRTHLTVVIMAAGQGTRMKSSLPKVLHPVCGRPMLHWVIAAAREAGAERCRVRHAARRRRRARRCPDGAVNAEQTEGEGTGSAVLAARDHVDPDSTVVDPLRRRPADQRAR